VRKVARGSALKPCIRPAKKEDLTALLELEKISFKEETFHKRQIEYLLLKAKSLVLVATLEGNIIGSIITLLRKHISNARIYSLNVHPSYRRTGIGSLLIDHSENLLVKMGYRNLTLEAGVNNIAARNLYISKGFSVVRKIEKYYSNGDDALRFIKRL
jgi:[ribosomal protein S18]-alanine N-acetyltransferase